MVPGTTRVQDHLMPKRAAIVLAAAVAFEMCAAVYLLAWSVVWAVPEAERDGLEWMGVALLALPWSLVAGADGWAIVHAEAIVNATALSAFVAWQVNGRWPSPAAS